MDFYFLPQFFVFALGLCVGSFLNCVIYRLEQKKSLKGRSFCPRCEHKLCWKDLFPVFSFLFLGGKCRYCKAKISWQYPAVELVTAMIFLLISKYTINFTRANFVVYLGLLFYFYIARALIIIFVYDLKHYIIPDKILFPAIFLTFLNLIFNFKFLPAQAGKILNCAAAAALASGFFLAVFLITKGRGMGFGDVKLATLMGLLLGFPNILVALFLDFFFGAIMGIILMVAKKKSLKSEIPFGPFLIAGTFLSLFWGSEIIQLYFKLFQIQ